MPDWRGVVEARLRGLRLPPARAVEIVDELSQHLQDRYDELRAGGATESEAERSAIADADVGDRLARELARVERHAAPLPPPGTGGRTAMETIWQDVRYTLRLWRRAPAFTAVVLATLALGIGANAAIFSVVDAVLLRPLPFPDADRIIILNERTRSGDTMAVSWPDYRDWRAQNTVFEHLGLYRFVTVNLTGGDQPERLNGAVMTSDAVAAMGVQPVAGRWFRADEDRAGTAPVALVSERLWRTRFGADRGLVGRAVMLNGVPHTIVGIMPPAMRFPSRVTDVWLCFGDIVRSLPEARGTHPNLIGVGRLKAGVPLERARADMDTVARRLEQQYPESNRDKTVGMIPYREQIVQNIRPILLVLVAAVGFVLVIACANLANLMLARADARQREIAIRAAVGAARRRLAQQLLTESLLLSIAGGALGVLLAWWSVSAFVASQPTSVPRIDLVRVDGRVLAFAFAISIVTGLAFGLVPAVRVASAALMSVLREGARGSAGLAARRFRHALIVVEVALALVLLIGAALMTRSFVRLMAIDPGFDAEHVVTMRIALPEAKYPDRARWTAFYDELLRRVSSVPGLDAVAVNSAVPLEGGGAESPVGAEGAPKPGPNERPAMCLFQTGSAEYFRAMGIPLLAGRSFDTRDTATSSPVVVVDETLVRRFFSGRNPIGKRVAFEFRGETREDPKPVLREIVGVVGYVHHYGLSSGPSYLQVYTPYAQLPIWFERRRPSLALFARTTADPQLVVGSIRREMKAIDPDIPVYGVQPMATYVSQTIEQPRLGMMLLASFAALALVLAVVGIYGVVSYLVGQRTREIGVRIALGASRGDVLRMILGEGLVPIGIGVALGVGASLVLARLISDQLYQVSPHDPATFAVIAASLTIVGVAAHYVPARSATRVDPLVALRTE